MVQWAVSSSIRCQPIEFLMWGCCGRNREVSVVARGHQCILDRHSSIAASGTYESATRQSFASIASNDLTTLRPESNRFTASYGRFPSIGRRPFTFKKYWSTSEADCCQSKEDIYHQSSPLSFTPCPCCLSLLLDDAINWYHFGRLNGALWIHSVTHLRIRCESVSCGYPRHDPALEHYTQNKSITSCVFDVGHDPMRSHRHCRRNDPFCFFDSAVKFIETMINARRVRFIIGRRQMETFLQVLLWQRLISKCIHLDRVILKVLDDGDYTQKAANIERELRRTQPGLIFSSQKCLAESDVVILFRREIVGWGIKRRFGQRTDLFDVLRIPCFISISSTVRVLTSHWLRKRRTLQNSCEDGRWKEMRFSHRNEGFKHWEIVDEDDETSSRFDKWTKSIKNLFEFNLRQVQCSAFYMYNWVSSDIQLDLIMKSSRSVSVSGCVEKADHSACNSLKKCTMTTAGLFFKCVSLQSDLLWLTFVFQQVDGDDYGEQWEIKDISLSSFFRDRRCGMMEWSQFDGRKNE